MKNQNTKNIIIILLVLIVGFSVFFVFKKSNNTGTELQENVVQEQDKNMVEENKNISSDTTPQLTDNDQKFNTAMRKAQDYLAKGDYSLAIDNYNQALKYKNSDLPYSGMFNVYSAQKKWTKAEESLNKAIELNAGNADYWKWKLSLLDDKTETSFDKLKTVFEEGFGKIYPNTRINLLVHFAQIAKNNNQTDEVIRLYKIAIDMNETNKDLYQAEIDRLNK